MKGKVVCHISYHRPLDDRIYWKELLSLKEAGYIAVHLCVSDADRDYITAEGIRIIEVKRKKLHAHIWLNRVAQILFKKRGIQQTLLNKAASLQAEVYHYHDLQINALVKGLKALPHHPKIIYDVHEVYWMVVKEQRLKGWFSYIQSRIISAFYKRWELTQAAYCNYIIATDDFTLQYFEKSIPQVPGSILFNYSYFIPAANLNAHKNYDFIYTGLLSESRGIMDAVQAIQLVAKTYPEVKLLLIGTFETPLFEEKVKAFIQTYNLQHNIYLHPQVPYTEIGSFYNRTKIGLGLFHTTPKYTTFIPIKLFEYMALGLPVIFSDHGPSAAIIREGGCGMLVEPNNIRIIAAAMQTLLTDKALYATCSRNGQQAVKDQYNWQKEKQKLLHIYSTLLGS